MSHIILCAGGTGGHVFPALATAKSLLKKEASLKITFLTDKKGEDASVLWKSFFLPRKNSKTTFPLFVIMMAYQLLVHIGKFLIHRPSLVVGFGGYPCVPVVLAAQILRIPTILHEQNAFLGRAHRILARFASLIALSFEKTKSLPEGIKTVLTGNPVRFGHLPPYTPKENHLHLFIFGGSQGAHAFSTLVPEALKLMQLQERQHITITHQCRPEDIEATQMRYHGLGIDAELSPFFKDMAHEYTKADIVIARSGASTLGELTVAGRCSIFVPYPFAMDDHQYHNAMALGDACFLFRQKEITPTLLKELILKLDQNPNIRKVKAAAIQSFSMEKASDTLAKVIIKAL